MKSDLDPRALGLTTYGAGNYTDALRWLSRHLESHPDDHEVRGTLALTYSALCMHVEAAMAIDHLLKLRPHSISANYYKARILERAGEYPEAYQHLRAVLTAKPDHPQARELLTQVEGKMKSASTVADRPSPLDSEFNLAPDPSAGTVAEKLEW